MLTFEEGNSLIYYLLLWKVNFLQIDSDLRVFLLMATVINYEELGEIEMSRFNSAYCNVRCSGLEMSV